jgi:hypothetical protein
MKEDIVLCKTNPLYRYFTDKIYETESEIRDNKDKLSKLTNKQKSLKRGLTKLVELRRELKIVKLNM